MLKETDSVLVIETSDSSSEFALMNADEFPMLANKENGRETGVLLFRAENFWRYLRK